MSDGTTSEIEVNRQPSEYWVTDHKLRMSNIDHPMFEQLIEQQANIRAEFLEMRQEFESCKTSILTLRQEKWELSRKVENSQGCITEAQCKQGTLEADPRTRWDDGKSAP